MDSVHVQMKLVFVSVNLIEISNQIVHKSAFCGVLRCGQFIYAKICDETISIRPNFGSKSAINCYRLHARAATQKNVQPSRNNGQTPNEWNRTVFHLKRERARLKLRFFFPHSVIRVTSEHFNSQLFLHRLVFIKSAKYLRIKLCAKWMCKFDYDATGEFPSSFKSRVLMPEYTASNDNRNVLHSMHMFTSKQWNPPDIALHSSIFDLVRWFFSPLSTVSSLARHGIHRLKL